MRARRHARANVPLMTPLLRGFAWALASAIAFGLTTPLVARFGASLGPLTIAALLYAGAALFASPFARDVVPVLSVRRRALLLGAQAIFGAMLAPAALAYGLHRTGALGASLALTMEVPLSIALAALAFREFVSRRVVVACIAIVVGAFALAIPGANSHAGGIGIAFVVAATAFWALDNALASLLVDVPFATTVFIKASLGAAFAALAAIVARESNIAAWDALGLVVVGAIGYGASLWMYLRAQRTFGIARTASVFAIAPFVGAVLALALGERTIGPATAFGFIAIAFGAYLHASERHAHPHLHASDRHEHVHRHDDDHHTHEHLPSFRGEHMHVHDHEPLAHVHAHASDPDHLHRH